jgi:acetyl esterase/lipase
MSIDAVDEICRGLCSKAGCVVMSVGYRLAPEHPYPAGPQDCFLGIGEMGQQALQTVCDFLKGKM